MIVFLDETFECERFFTKVINKLKKIGRRVRKGIIKRTENCVSDIEQEFCAKKKERKELVLK